MDPYASGASQSAACTAEWVDTQGGLSLAMCLRVLDEMSSSLLVVEPGGRIVHLNHAARRELRGGSSIRNDGGMLRATHPQDDTKLQSALTGPRSAGRSLVELAHPPFPLAMAIVPLPADAPSTPATLLVICSRPAPIETLTVQMYARSRQLTPMELTVLHQLCAGRAVAEIAEQLSIAPATVRSHVKHLRQKCHCDSVRELVVRIGQLPQIVSAIRLAAIH